MNSFSSGISLKKLWDEAPFASVMAILNISIFIMQLIFRELDGVYTLEFYGAIVKSFVLEDGEFYRILTAGFLHWDLLHLIFNVMFGLIIITSFLERKIGSLRTGLIYFSVLLLSGLSVALLGEIGSSITDGPTFTLGASGAIYGVLGALLFITVMRKDLLSGRDIQSIRSLIFINIMFTLFSANISAVGHFSGLIFGFLVAFLFIPRDKSEYDIYH